MGLLNQTERQYYSGKKTFTGDGSTNKFTIIKANAAFYPTQYNGCLDCLKVYKDGVLNVAVLSILPV